MNDNLSALRVYRAPVPGYYFVCRTRWDGTTPVDEHIEVHGRKVKWVEHERGARVTFGVHRLVASLVVERDRLRRRRIAERAT